MWKKTNNLNSLEEIFEAKNHISFDDFEAQTKEYILPEVKDVQNMVLEAKRQGKLVTVVGDYDVDGVCASTIVDIALTYLEINHSIRLPKRISEGFGLSKTIIDEINEGLIITVDNGIAAIDAIKAGKEKGLDIIVTDHHLPPTVNGKTILPEADYILDPHVLNSEFEDYCGAGIAYKIFKDMVPYELSQKMLSLAAIATIADVMPLVKENRYIVQQGLKSMTTQTGCTRGLYALLCELDLNNYIEEMDIGFTIGPILNAPGRLEDDGANISLNLLRENSDDDVARTYALKAIEMNKRRKELTENIMADIERNIEINGLMHHCPLIIYQPNIPEGIVGLISGRVAEKYKVPVVTLTDSENKGILKGSGRSNGDLNIFEMLNKYNDKYIKFGGHADACGLSIKQEFLDELRDTLVEEYFDYKRPSDDILYDMEITEYQIPELLEKLKKFKPFGQANPAFVFKISNFELYPHGSSYYEIKGSNQKTVILNGKYTKAANFKIAERYLHDDCPKKLHLVGTVSLNYYYNTYKEKICFSPQIIFEDYEIVSDYQKPMTLLQRKLLEKAKNN